MHDTIILKTHSKADGVERVGGWLEGEVGAVALGCGYGSASGSGWCRGQSGLSIVMMLLTMHETAWFTRQVHGIVVDSPLCTC